MIAKRIHKDCLAAHLATQLGRGDCLWLTIEDMPIEREAGVSYWWINMKDVQFKPMNRHCVLETRPGWAIVGFTRGQDAHLTLHPDDREVVNMEMACLR